MSRDALDALLHGYTQRHLPSLALRTNITSGRVCASVSYDDKEASRSLLLAAVVRLVCAYVDSTDVLLADLRYTDDDGDIPSCSTRTSSSLPPAPYVTRMHVALDATRRQAIEAVRHTLQHEAQKWPFEQLVEATSAQGFTLKPNQSPALITFGDADAVSRDWYPVHGVAVLRDERVRQISVIGDAAVLSDEMADVFARQVISLTRVWTNDDAASIAALSLPEDDLMSAFEPPYDSNEAHLPIDWLTRNARRRPDAIAHELCDEPDDDNVRILTYGQLDKQSNRMANWLRNELHVERGAPIGVCRKRDESFYISMAAILKAGACYLPIDRDLPEERKTFIMQDSHSRILLTDDNHTSLRGEHQCFNLDDMSVQGSIALHSDAPPSNVHVDLDDLAYILYTSGTSGKPKGCLLMHRGLYWAIRTFVEVPRAITDPDKDKRLAMAAVAFDVHVSEMVQCWAIGLRLVSVASRMSLLADLQATIERFGITHVGMVPSMIEATLTKKPSELPIKYITSGGEKISDAVLAAWAAHPDKVFANMYGPTEATIGCTTRIIRGVDEPKEDIGYPFVGSGAYIVDGQLNVVPRGVAGELIIEGPLVARGYLNLPEATAKSFLEWPRKGCRAYRTGDLVRMNFDGSLSIHGRIDSQIKLRGVRIESEGVSAVVRRAAADAAVTRLDAVSVICKHSAVGNADMLVTFVTPLHGTDEHGRAAAPSANDRRGTPTVLDLAERYRIMTRLREACVKELASYMRPSHIVPLTFFPLSHNGKIDTKPLVALFAETPMQRLISVQALDDELAQDDADDDAEATNRDPTETERLLIKLISELTSVSPSSISTRRSLLENGLSSLNGARLTSMIRQHVNGGHCRVTVSQVLACESLSECAALIDRQESGQPDERAVAHSFDLGAYEEMHRNAVLDVLSADSFSALLPPLPVQPGILFHAMHNASGYVQHFGYRFRTNEPSRITAHQLNAAWKEVQRRLDVLRVAFVLDKEHLVQVILHAEHCPLPFTEQQWAQSSDDDIEKVLNDKDMLDAISKSINEDLTTPMFAVTTLVDGDDQYAAAMIVSLSHTIYDAFAVRSIMSTLNAVLASGNGSEEQTQPQQPSLATVVQQIRSIASDQDHARFWQQTLEAPLREREQQRRKVRGDDATTAIRPSRGETALRRNNVLDDVALDDVQRACKRWGVTLQTFFNVVFAVSARTLFAAVGQPLGSKYAVFGNVRSGRNVPIDGIEHAACPLVTVVPCVIEFPTIQDSQKHHDVQRLMRTAHRALVASTEHENVALSEIQTWVKQRNIVEALFSCRVERSADRRDAYDRFQHIATSATESEFALAVEVLLDQTADSIDLRVAHAPSVFSNELIDGLMKRMLNNVRAFLNESQTDDGDDEERYDVKTARSGGKRNIPPPVEVDPARLKQLQTAIAAFLQQDADMIQPKTSLVSLGMTSLRAVALCHALSKKHGIDLDPIDVVQGDTAVSMAITLAQQDAQQQQGAVSAATAGADWSISEDEQEELGDVRLTGDDEIEVAPCTPLQAGMLSQTVATEGRLYVHAFALKLHAGVRQRLDDLEQAWSAVHRTFGILRCSFHFVAKTGTWLQVQHSVHACPLTIDRINVHDDNDDDGTVDALRRAAIRTLNLSTEQALASRPPMRLLLSADGGTFVLALHHAMYDGVSLSNLLGLVGKAFQKGEQQQLAPLSSSFLTLARQLVATEEQATQYWLERLRGTEDNVFVKPNRLSGAASNDSTQAWRDGLQFTLEESQAALRFCRRYRSSLQSVGQVAFAMTLYRQSHLADVVFCQVVSGRARKLAGDVMGPVFNTVGIRIALLDQGALTAKQAVQRAQEHNGRALPWQHASLRRVQQRLQRTSLSDALFLFQPALEDEDEDNDKHSSPWTLITPTSEEGSTQFTLNLELHEAVRGEGTKDNAVMAVRASAAAAILTQTELTRIVQTYKSELLAIVHAPNRVLVEGGSGKSGKVCGRDDDKKLVNGHGKVDNDKTAVGPLIDVLREVLHVQNKVKLTRQTSLSSIGLDSIAAMQVASRTRKQGLTASLSPMRVLRCSTVGDLLAAAAASSAGKKPNGHHSDDLTNGTSRTAPVPVADVVKSAMAVIDASIRDHVRAYVPSAGMRYLFAGWQRSRGRQFQICIGRKLAERADEHALQRSWASVVAHHAILRSTVVPTKRDESQATQLVLFVVEKEHWKGTFLVDDKREKSDDEHDGDDDEQAKTIGRQLLRRPASMTVPSSRVTLVRLRTADYVFVQLPHTHYDAFTVPRLMDELWQGYVSLASDDEMPTSERGDDAELEAYLAEVASLPRKKGDADQGEATYYWQSQLGREHEPHIWTEPFDETDTVHNVGSHTVTYYVREKRDGTPTVRALQEAAHRLDITPAALLTSTWAHVHAARHRSSISSSTFAFVHSGRSGEQAGLEDVHVPTINLVPTKVYVSATPSRGDGGGGGPEDDAMLFRSVEQSARVVQKQWLEQPAWAVHSAMADICRWVTAGEVRAVCNTTLNIQIRPTQHGKGASLRDSTATKQQQRWTPVVLRGPPYGPHGDRGWSPEELKSFDVPSLFLHDDGSVCDPTVRIDARIVVAASQEADANVEPVLVLEAEVAREVFERRAVDDTLAQWAELLTKVVKDMQLQ